MCGTARATQEAMKKRQTVESPKRCKARRDLDSQVLVLDRYKDEWAAAISRAKREEHEWDDALRRARRGSEAPCNTARDEPWDEGDEWAFRLALVRTGVCADSIEPATDRVPALFDEDQTAEFEPGRELLGTADDEVTQEVVIPQELLDAMAI